MSNPDELPIWLALPSALALLIVWRRQVIAERRRARRR